MGIKEQKRVIGILASVDSGKTTLAEALLFHGGALRKPGRVDHGDAFLDTGAMERRRGITIVSKMARLKVGDASLILLDTPGHADFTPETERTLAILDGCILVINGADGITAQTRRLWNLLAVYRVPVFLFVNKIDQAGVDPEKIFQELKTELTDHILDFSNPDFLVSEETATLSENLLDEYVETGRLSLPTLRQAIAAREVFPCWFGSALKEIGIEEFLAGLILWSADPVYPAAFSGRVYKISRDEQGQRLTWLKVTGGSLLNKSLIGEEKVNEIRLYSGQEYVQVQSAQAGEVCALAGLKNTRANQVLGDEGERVPEVFPVLRYRIQLDAGGDQARLLNLLRELEEEMPDLHVTVDDSVVEVRLMGEMMLEVLMDEVFERGGMKISVDEGGIVYRETITAPVIGIGHFEPLRHYAEVHLLLEPSDQTGIAAASQIEVNRLSGSRQQQILRYLREGELSGVLTGAALSHMKISLVGARDHHKHTQGGDLREAARRALRHGLLQARDSGECRLLEPVYQFEIKVATEIVGRVLNDLDRLGARSITTFLEGGQMTVTGQGPVATLRGYGREVMILSRGQARLSFEFGGYESCHNEAAVVEQLGYDPLKDPANPGGSIFCANGAGYFVPWDRVRAMAHVEPIRLGGDPNQGRDSTVSQGNRLSIAPDEIDRILKQTFYANANEKKQWKKQKARPREESVSKVPGRVTLDPVYLLVDGYNVIHAWPELAELAKTSFDGARDKLTQVLLNYQGFTGEQVELVFDAWKVPSGIGSRQESDGLTVVFTRENETADRWIERRAVELARDHIIKVVTSDQAEQMMAQGTGAFVYSARRFREIIAEVGREIMATWKSKADPDSPLRPMANQFASHEKSDLASPQTDLAPPQTDPDQDPNLE